MATKFSQLPSGGLVQVGAQLVGLSAATADTRYDFPGTGITDASGNMLLGWLPASPGPAVNYIEFQSAITGAEPTISAVGADASISLMITAKGTGDISLAASDFVNIISTGAIVMPVGNTGQRPLAVAGAMRYNTDTGLMEYYDGVIPAWASIGTGTGSVTAVNGTPNVISSTGGTTPQIDIDVNYVGQASITTLGTITTGTWNGTPVTVPFGGTGITSATAYSVLCGGTTSTGPFQSVAGLGSAGQVLTSNGAGSLPTWQATGNVASITAGTGISVTGTPTVPIVSISATYTGQSSIVTVGTITSGTWNGTVIAGQYGGTGMANTGQTITLGGNLTTSGAFPTTITVTGSTSVTLPTSGTLAILGNNDFNFSTQYRQQIKDYSETVNVLGNVSGAVVIDLTLGNAITATATGVISSITVTNVPVTGQEASFSLYATNFGAFAITWPTGTQWPGGLTPSLNSPGLSIVVFTTVDGGTTWQAFYPGQSGVVSVATGTGLTGGTITSSGTISVVINDMCTGRLTLSTNTPVTSGDVLAATTLYWTPYKGNYVTLYTAGVWELYTFTQLSIAVPATTSTMYDVFVYDNSGVLTLSTVAWTNDTTRATSVVFQDGVYVLSGSPQYRYLGSFRTIASGQTEDSVANRFVWNYYNRVARPMQVIPVSNWSYAANTIRQANASTSNQLNMVVGVAEDVVKATVNVSLVSGGTNVTYAIMIGLDSTTALSANSTSNYCTMTASLVAQTETAIFAGYVGVGKHSLTWLETAPAAVSVVVATSATGSFVSTGMQGTILG